MTFHRLNIFCKVVEYQGFSNAATNLYTTQPSITKIIQSLEVKVGVELFARNRQRSKGVALTDAGQQVYATAKEILALWNQLDSQLSYFKPPKSQAPKLITIITGCSVGTYLLPPLLNKFRMEFSNNVLPEVCFATDFHDTLEAVKQHLYDIVIFPDFPHPNSLRLPANFAFKENLIAIGNSDFYQSDLLYDIEELQLILPIKTSINRKIIEHYFNSNNLTPNVVFEMGHPESVKQIIRTGSMVSILPYHAAEEELEQGIFLPLKLLKPLPAITYKVALSKNHKMTKEVSKFLTFLNKELNDEPAATGVYAN